MSAPERTEPAQAEEIDATSAPKVVGNAGWSLALYVVPQAYTLVLSIAGARYLGAEGLGRQSYIAFVALSLTAILSGGLQAALTRFVGEAIGRRETQLIPHVIRRSVVIVCVLAAVALGTLGAASLVATEERAAWLLAAGVAAISVIHVIPVAVLVGLQRWRASAVVGIVTGAGGVAATIVVLAAGGGIAGMFAVELVIAVLNLAWMTWLLRGAPVRGRGETPPRADIRRHVRFALFSTAGGLVTLVVWRRSEFFFLERYSGDVEIALYSIPFALVAALGQVPAALAGALVPALATLYGAGAMDRIRSGYGRSVRLVVFAGVPLAAGLIALGPALIRTVYGAEYADAGVVAIILASTVPLVAVFHVAGALLGGLGRAVAPLLVGVLAAVVTLSADVLLIPEHGAVGAAIANVSGQFVAAVLLAGYAARVIDARAGPRRGYARVLLAAAGAGAAAWAVERSLSGAAGLVAGLAVGLASFAVLGHWLAILSSDDAAWLARAAPRQLTWGVSLVTRLWSRPPPSRSVS